ncbi:UNVERIFIED_CONTAM: hypothetical protein FKN15_041584 [Acipenser sinensis]
MILGDKSPSLPVRALCKGKRVPWTGWPDNSFPRLGGSWPSRKGEELWYTKSSIRKVSDVAAADWRSCCNR